MESILNTARFRAALFFSSFPLSPDALAGGQTPRWRKSVLDSMNYFMGRREMERRLWSESYTREIQMVDEILRPWVRQHISEGVSADEMLDHESAAALLASVAQWCQEYARWRIGSNLPFIKGHPVEGWAHVAPPERRPGLLFRVADYVEGQGETEQAWRLRRWALLVLLDEYASEMSQSQDPPA